MDDGGQTALGYALVVRLPRRENRPQRGSRDFFNRLLDAEILMIDMQAISTGLKLGEDGIWRASTEEKISYPEEGNEACFALEDGSFWFKHRTQCIARLVQRYPPRDNGAVFDIGGGNGVVAMGLLASGLEVVLVEPGRTGAANAQRRGMKNIVQATTETAGFLPRSFPAAGLFDVLEHIEDDLMFLKSLRNLMMPQGRLYLTVPAFALLWSEEDDLAGHFRRYSMRQLRRTLVASGFEVEFETYLFRFLPLPIFFLRTLRHWFGIKRKGRSITTASRDHAVSGGETPAILNRLLKSELAAIDRQKSIRFGGSCLVVAKNP
ncbi:MAG: class I SAM-dependent methyltransferase [Kiritimatiellia bacterium]